MNMSHPHAKDLITDEENNATIASHQFPKPMGWKVLVQPNQAKKQTKGGIYLPSQSMENEEYLTAHGTILAKGELAYRDRETGNSWKGDWPQVGDCVTYGKYAGQKLTVNGVKMLLLNDDEITSIIPEGANLTSYVT